MATFEDVARKAAEDGAFLGALATDPERALKDAGFDLSHPEDVRRVELFALTAQENIMAAARVIEIDPAPIERSGVGMSCCNHHTLLPTSEPTPPTSEPSGR